MTLKQTLTIASAALLAVVIFFSGELQPPPKKDSSQNPSIGSSNNSQAMEIQSFAKQKKAALDGSSIRDIIKSYEKEFDEVTDEREKLSILDKLDSICKANELTGLSAYYAKQASSISSTQERLLRTGKRFKRLIATTDDSTQKQQFKQIAIQSLRAATQRDSSNYGPRITLANLYLQNRKEVMKGITILLDIVENKPDHPRANLILGRYGIISGQYNKAISRLKKVAGSDTLQARAHFHLGEAHYASGNKKKALDHFTKSKESMNNPALKDTIDKYIDNIQNI